MSKKKANAVEVIEDQAVIGEPPPSLSLIMGGMGEFAGAPTTAINLPPPLRVVPNAPLQLQALIDNGIPVRKAVFHRTIMFETTGGSPETCFYSPKWSNLDMKAHKIASMWYTPHGLIMEQKGVFKIVPLANVSDCHI